MWVNEPSLYVVKLQVFLYYSSLQMSQKSLHILDEINEKLNNGFQIVTKCFPTCGDLCIKNYILSTYDLTDQPNYIHKH